MNAFDMERSTDSQHASADSQTIAVLFDAVGTLIYPAAGAMCIGGRALRWDRD
ncbi:MAG: hypothetical protein R3C99_23930 [Pirellulaceae bacterium]